MSNVKLYALGGTGIDVIGKISGDVDYAHFDTSESNIRKSKEPDRSYLVHGVDGSGQNRKENEHLIREHMDVFLANHEPMDHNIVVCGGGGGTGSAACPIIVERLLKAGHNVIVVTAISNASKINVANCHEMFVELNELSETLQMPINIVAESASHHGNDFDKMDKAIASYISLISVLFAQDYDRLDSKDIGNFINYSKNPSVEALPGLGAMSIVTSDDDLSTRDMYPVSLLSLYTNPSESYDPAILDYAVEYTTAGYTDLISDAFGTTYEGTERLHFVIEQDRMSNIAEDIRIQHEQYKKASTKRIRKPNAFAKA